MDSQSSQNPSTASVVYLPVAPKTPTPFHGDTHEDIEDWLQHYERVARHNGWSAEHCLQNLYFSLEGTATQAAHCEWAIAGKCTMANQIFDGPSLAKVLGNSSVFVLVW
ncbi:hypothetical protein ISCGN_011882 [Ixodes scapularis]